ncbi:MAG TPA: class I SAM-dependent methyltransferase [Beijerinckiaceae bacterium]|jgi:hypothetical protein
MDQGQLPRLFASATELLEDALRQRRTPGLVIEFGVYKGRSLDLIACSVFPEPVVGFDSFMGLPEHWRSGFRKGTFATDIPKVKSNVQLVVGQFEETLPKFISQMDQDISFLHVDCDLYSSTTTVLRHCRDRICAGTVIVFDEFHNYPGWENHEYKAFSEFLSEERRTFRLLSAVPGGEQVAVVMTGEHSRGRRRVDIRE